MVLGLRSPKTFMCLSPWLHARSHSAWSGLPRTRTALLPATHCCCHPSAGTRFCVVVRWTKDLVHLKSNTATTATQRCYQWGQFSELGFETAPWTVGSPPKKLWDWGTSIRKAVRVVPSLVFANLALHAWIILNAVYFFIIFNMLSYSFQHWKYHLFFQGISFWQCQRCFLFMFSKNIWVWHWDRWNILQAHIFR